MTPTERDLDRVISKGGHSGDPEVDDLAATARQLGSSLQVDAPAAERERALFIQGVASRRPRRRATGFLAPALAGATLIVALGYIAGGALPGDDAYPLRRVMAAVGLVRSPAEEVESRITRAEQLVSDAEELAGRFPGRARARALDAVYHLRTAERLLTDVRLGRRADLTVTITELERRAVAVIGAVLAPQPAPSIDDDSSGPGSGDDEDDDSSGPGSGDDDEDDDNSGPGSDDDDGSGSGSDDDNSGPGSDDDDGSGSGSDDDNSGPGSGDDD